MQGEGPRSHSFLPDRAETRSSVSGHVAKTRAPRTGPYEEDLCGVGCSIGVLTVWLDIRRAHYCLAPRQRGTERLVLT